MERRVNYISSKKVLNTLLILFFITLFASCKQGPDQAMGTLEWDRVNCRIPASEVITETLVKEGQRVSAGTVLLQIDNRKIAQQYLDLKARHQMASWQLKELEAGPLPQTIAEARARLEASQATLKNSAEIFNRQQNLFTTNFTSREDLDNARNVYLTRKEKTKELTETLDRLVAGTRIEQIEQARFNVASLAARVEQMRLLEDDYSIKAARDGVVDSLPYKQGDRPPAQAVVCTLLAGNSPWARVYIPETFRSVMLPGNDYILRIDGQQIDFTAQLRTISSEASFTPYFALSEDDRARLSYVAELNIIDPSAKNLTAGTPVQLLLGTK